jgi:hypothetical protein
MGLAKMYKNRDQGIRASGHQGIRASGHQDSRDFFYRIDRIMQDRQDKKDV